jgi:hypothetical protein
MVGCGEHDSGDDERDRPQEHDTRRHEPRLAREA